MRKDRHFHISRRRFLHTLASLSALSLPLAPTLLHGRENVIRKRTIPSTGERIASVGLGTYQTFDVGSDRAIRDRLAEVLTRFAEMGGQVVDSSPMYGNAETVVGDLAATTNTQDKLFYATKVWTQGEQQGIREMQTSMQRMRVKSMDLMQVHNLVDWKTHLRTLYEWKEQQRIRYLGITHYLTSAFDDMERIIKKETLDFIQIPYNILNTDAEARLLPLAKDRGVAVIVNVPFAQGGLFRHVRNKPLPSWAAEFDCNSWAQFFLKFILSHPAVTCPIPATSKPKHLVDNMGAGFGALPGAKTREKMKTLMRDLV
jgi:diketogulonate reductase-like aldo/keto reductase